MNIEPSAFEPHIRGGVVLLVGWIVMGFGEGGIVGLVSALLSMGAVLVGWALLKYFWQRRSEGAWELPMTSSEPVTRREIRQMRGGPGWLMLQPAVEEERNQGEQFFFAEDVLGKKSCERCGRSFPGVFDQCPYDGGQLKTGEVFAGVRPPEMLDRKVCIHCGRRYHLDVDFCHHDGIRLERDDRLQAEGSEATAFCRQCGYESQTGERKCPRDGERLARVVPGQVESAPPLIPMMECRSCGYLGGPNSIRCPEDHTILSPLLTGQPWALPATGAGPRRKVCGECGEGYSDACDYCAFDGAELVEIN